MAESEVLPRSVLVLGDALRPVSDMLAATLSDTPARTRPCADAVEFVQDHLERLAGAGGLVGQLTDEVNDGLDRVLGPDVADADVWRAVGRLEFHVERIVDGYDRVRRVKPYARDARGVSLLGAVYREVLLQIEAWLNDILAFVDDPLADLGKRGLPTSGHVELNIGLTLNPPQASDLVRWVDERTERKSEDAKASGWGLAALLLAVFGLGWFFGDDD